MYVPYAVDIKTLQFGYQITWKSRKGKTVILIVCNNGKRYFNNKEENSKYNIFNKKRPN